MAASEGRIAKKYARALFEQATPQDLEAIKLALGQFVAHWENSQELRDALTNPANPVRERTEVLRAIAQVLRPGDTSFGNFLVILLENGRLNNVQAMHSNFSVLIDELKKRLALEVTSAFQVPDAEQSQFQQKIQGEFGSLASIQWKVDTSILGGLCVKAGDKLLDGSLNGALEHLRTSLMN